MNELLQSSASDAALELAGLNLAANPTRVPGHPYCIDTSDAVLEAAGRNLGANPTRMPGHPYCIDTSDAAL